GNTDIEATYNYAAFSSGSAHVTGSAHSNHIEGPGIYVDYLLTELKTNTNLVLDNTGATDTVLGAKISGTGNLTIQARDTQIFLSHSNAYTGTTTISSGTLIAAANDVLGQTSYLIITSTAAYNLNGHTQTIANGARIDGTLAGSGSLGLGGLATITSTNAAFAANIGVTGTTTINNTQALGNTGTLDIASGATLSADGATGDLSKTLAGQGGVSLVNSATITLTADNTNYSGTFAISATSRLAASTDANLGNTALSGSGVFEKIDAATTLTIARANETFTGTTIVNAGALRLENLLGTGTGAVLNNAILDLAGTGAFANNISGTGTTAVTGAGVNLTGTNSTDWNITGAAQVSTPANLGLGNTHIDGELTLAATTAWAYSNTLTGAGTLAVNLSGNAFTFSPSALHPSSPFRGTLVLDDTVLTLGVAANTDVLANAALQLNAGGILHANGETRRIAALALNGGALWLPMNGVDPVEVLRTGTLSITDLSSTVVFENYTGGATPIIDSLAQKNWLDQDNLTDNATLLVFAETVSTPGVQIAIRQADGTALSNGQVIEHTEVNAIYNYTAQTAGTASAYTGTAGLYYDYVLVELNVKDGKTLSLTSDGATDNTLAAAITGPGSVLYNTASTMILTGSNTYTGTSTLATGTLIAGVDNALGQTDQLYIDAGALLDLNDHAQTIANGGRVDGHITGTGALTLAGGTLAITTSNTAYTAQTNINADATARLADAAGLGTAAIELEGVLVLDTAADGTLQNTLSGAGALIKDNVGAVTINHANTAFSGAAEIASGRLVATKTDSLGTAAITVAAGAAFEQLNLTGTLQNELHGEGLHQLTNSTLHLANPAGYTIAATTLDATSALILETTGYRFRALELNNGALAFDATAPTAAAQIDTLGDTTGRLILNAKLADITAGINPAGTVANHLAIADAGAGRHDVYINPVSEPPAAINFAIELITTGSGGATFAMANPGGKLEYDLTTIELVQGDGSDYTPDTNKWYLSDRNLSHAADAILNTASTLALDWAAAMDALHLRL
ncbi:autotransporter-associated beta strand protein, partial [Ereboglobus sp. PH5-5]|uniref:pertactin-like passenger domain-containing protein n=1 Tax=Ereboglobus sp. PH5-5 TaxID=2940529 RepID=UPI002406C44A